MRHIESGNSALISQGSGKHHLFADLGSAFIAHRIGDGAIDDPGAGR
jgi:hypothetical protein